MIHYKLLVLVLVLVFFSCSTDNQVGFEVQHLDIQKEEELNRLFSGQDLEVQQQALDSLEQIHKGRENQYLYILSQFLEGFSLMNQSHYNQALDLFLPILENNNTITEYPNFHLRTINKVLSCYIMLEEMDKTLRWVEEGNRIEEKVTDLNIELEFKTVKSSIYSSVNKYSEALSLSYEVVDFFENNKLNPSLMINAYNDLALILVDLNKFSDAEDYIKKAFAVFEEMDGEDERNLAITYNNAAIIYKGLNQSDKAITAIEKSIDINNKYFQNDVPRVVKNYYNLGMFYLELDSSSANAFSSFKKGLDKSSAIDFESGIGYNSFGVGEYYLANGDVVNAEKYLLRAEQIFRSQGNQQMLYNVLGALLKIARKNGALEKAIAYYDEYFQLEKLYHEFVLNRDTEELSIKHKVEQTEVDNEFLKNALLLKQKNNEQKNVVLALLIMVIVTAFVLLSYLITSQRKIKVAHTIVKDRNREIEKKNNALNELIHERDALVKTIIHDLRNPLSSIQGVTHLLVEENSQEEKKLFVNLLNSSSNQLDILISSLLNAYKENERIQLKDRRELSVNKLIAEIIQGFEFDAMHKEIKIHQQLEEFTVLSDRSSLYSIFGNLISNAIKFSPKQKNIYIKLSKNTDFWEFCIKDEGPGFSQEDQNNMFSMFRKLSAHPTSNENSTGIGLYSVRKTIERLGGEIELNVAYTEGAEFICRFPL